MSTQVNRTVIGIFMVSAVALLVAAVLILGSGKFFTDRPRFVMFFDGSVQGLSVGSPVVFRGVKVGEVVKIKLSYNPKDLSIRIPVIMEFGEGNMETVEGNRYKVREGKRKEFGEKLIEKGLRAQLAMQSIVTGQLMITLDFFPNKPAKFVGLEKKYQEIPTIPTPLQELTRKLEKLPIEDILNKVQEAMTGISKLVNSPETATVMKSISEGIAETRSLMRNMDRQVEPAAASLTETAREVKKLAARIEESIGPLVASVTRASDEAGITLKRTEAVMRNAEGFMDGESAMGYRVMRALDEFEGAARSIRSLADTLDKHPEVLIYGKKGTGKEAGK